MRFSIPLRRRGALLFAACVGFAPCLTRAATPRTWIDGTLETWNVPTNWSPAGVPSLGDTAKLVQSDATNRQVVYVQPDSTAQINLSIDATGSGTIELVQNQDSLRASL